MIYKIEVQVKDITTEDAIKLAEGCVGAMVLARYPVLVSRARFPQPKMSIITLTVDMPHQVAKRIQNVVLVSLDNIAYGDMELKNISEREDNPRTRIITS